MTHDELVQRAVSWLKNHHGCRVVLAELHSSARCRPDAIGWHMTWSVLVECKTSRGDFRRDAKKFHVRYDRGPGRQLWYMAPAGLLRESDFEDDVTSKWGWVEVRGRRCIIRRPATARELPQRGVHDETAMLLSAVARHEQGQPWDSVARRFRPGGAK